jgi:hypothetical protein
VTFVGCPQFGTSFAKERQVFPANVIRRTIVDVMLRSYVRVAAQWEIAPMTNAKANQVGLTRVSIPGAILVAALALVGGTGLLGGASPAVAQSIHGTWSGGGMIIFPSGEKEHARCRATFRPAGGGGISMQGICATASVRVSQSASLSRLTSTTYSGEFYNTEYNISGSIRIRLHGNTLNASLNGGGATAQFVLGR